MSRQCAYPRPKCGGKSCSGQTRQWVSCNTHCCTGAYTATLAHGVDLCQLLVHGGWTSWQFGQCSAACGGGTRNVTRSCTNPSPYCNGSDCDGENYRSEKCNMHCCAGNYIL